MYRLIPLESLARTARSSMMSPFTMILCIAPFSPVVMPESRLSEYAYLMCLSNKNVQNPDQI